MLVNWQNIHGGTYRASCSLINPLTRYVGNAYDGFRDRLDSVLFRSKNALITTLAASVFCGGIANVSSAKDGLIKQATPSQVQRYKGLGRDFSGVIKDPFNPEKDIRRLAAKLMSDDARSLLNGYKRRALPPTNIPDELEEQTPALKRRPRRYETFSIKPNAKSDEEVWSLEGDLGKYRAYAVKQGSRYFAENIKKVGSHTGLAIEDIVNVFTLASSDRGKPLRENDGKPISFHLEKVGEVGGEMLDNILNAFYSSADLATLDLVSDLENKAYQANHALVRPFVYTGRSIGSAWKTLESAGNVPTFGYFDNVTGSTSMFFENTIETLKHGCEAVTNLPRGCIYLIGKNENVDKIQDWVWLVPLEYLSNVIEMKGISNTQDYKNAFKEKGVIGSTAEMVGSGFIVGKSIYELIDELSDKGHKRHKT